MQANSILVKNLPMSQEPDGTWKSDVDESFLRNFFEDEIGHVKEVRQRAFQRNGHWRSYAVITFETRKLGKRAVNKLNYTKLNDCPIFISLGL